MASTIEQHIRQFDLGALITLYILDTTVIGGADILYFTPMTDGDDKVVFDGNTYEPLPVETTGWQVTSNTAPPRPLIKVSNTQRHFSSYVVSLGDLVGATLTRIQTFENFLDGKPDADPNATLEKQTYIVSKKKTHNPLTIEWELIHNLERPGLKLPRRKILKDLGFPGVSTYPRT